MSPPPYGTGGSGRVLAWACVLAWPPLDPGELQPELQPRAGRPRGGGARGTGARARVTAGQQAAAVAGAAGMRQAAAGNRGAGRMWPALCAHCTLAGACRTSAAHPRVSARRALAGEHGGRLCAAQCPEHARHVARDLARAGLRVRRCVAWHRAQPPGAVRVPPVPGCLGRDRPGCAVAAWAARKFRAADDDRPEARHATPQFIARAHAPVRPGQGCGLRPSGSGDAWPVPRAREAGR